MRDGQNTGSVIVFVDPGLGLCRHCSDDLLFLGRVFSQTNAIRGLLFPKWPLENPYDQQEHYLSLV
jgi:hypothetical protein